jgi:DNA-binding XRE family transcriptional regulator
MRYNRGIPLLSHILSEKGMNRVKEFRKELKISQTKMAKYFNTLTQPKLCEIENNVRTASYKQMLEICSYFGKPLDEVFPDKKRTIIVQSELIKKK